MFVTCILQVHTARDFFLDQLKAGLAGFENLNTQPPESIDHSYLGSIKSAVNQASFNQIRPVRQSIKYPANQSGYLIVGSTGRGLSFLLMAILVNAIIPPLSPNLPVARA